MRRRAISAKSTSRAPASAAWADLCREHQISESLLRRWRDVALDAAGERLAGGQDRSVHSEQRKRIAELERALGKKTYELEIVGNGVRRSFPRLGGHSGKPLGITRKLRRA